MSIIYYYAPMSSAIRTTWAIEELGIDCERRLIDLSARGTREDWFVQKNPNGKVPMLEVDGVPIFESTAILLYVGEVYGVEQGLFPAPGMVRGQVFQWIEWAQATLFEAIQRYTRNVSPLVPEEQRNAKAAEVAKDDLTIALGILDRTLAGRQYLVGEAFSFADLATAGYLAWLDFLSIDYSKWQNVDAWATRCRDRPAHRRSLAW